MILFVVPAIGAVVQPGTALFYGIFFGASTVGGLFLVHPEWLPSSRFARWLRR